MPAKPRRRYALNAPARAILYLAALACIGPASGQEPVRGPNATGSASKGAVDAGDAEAAALAFVRENHPDLAPLLAQLKPMKPAEYQKAVRELAQVSRSLAQLKGRDPERFALGLEAWKARSRVDLLAARLAGASGPGTDMEDQLRQAVADQVDVEIRRQRFEREAARERLRRVNETLERLESRRASAVESRFQSLLKKSRNARRQAAARPPRGNTNAGADAPGPKTKEEREP